MSIHVRVCNICQRAIPADAAKCSHCPQRSTCVCCGAGLKPAMLHCRECGTSTVNPSQRNSAQNGNPKTVTAAGVLESDNVTGMRPNETKGGRRTVNSTETITSPKATNSQPLQVKPSQTRPRPLLSSVVSSHAASVIAPLNDNGTPTAVPRAEPSASSAHDPVTPDSATRAVRPKKTSLPVTPRLDQHCVQSVSQVVVVQTCPVGVTNSVSGKKLCGID